MAEVSVLRASSPAPLPDSAAVADSDTTDVNIDIMDEGDRSTPLKTSLTSGDVVGWQKPQGGGTVPDKREKSPGAKSCSPTDRDEHRVKRTPDAEDEDVEDDGQGNHKKKRHRRKNKGGKHHRKWKPYTKMSWEEKKKIDDRESRRAVQKREQMAACGQPMAPYNTTQFLMEQHQPMDAELSLEEPPARVVRGEGPGSVESSDEYYDSPNDEQEIFLEKDFTEAYENFHAERLQAMTKDDLVREHLQLETKIENMEFRLKELGENNQETGRERVSSGDGERSAVKEPSTAGVEAAGVSAASKLRQEIQRLQEENAKLRKENEDLRKAGNS